MKGALAMNLDLATWVYDPATRQRMSALIDLNWPATLTRTELSQAEVLVAGWGAPTLSEALLSDAPHLRLVLYGAGSVKAMVTEAVWDRGIRVCSAWRANAIPVVEYTLGTILLSLKGFWRHARQGSRAGIHPAGGYRSTVGLISLGAVGLGVLERLRGFEIHMQVYDPFLSEAQAAELGVTRASLDELFATSDVVSIHTPALPETRKMLSGAHFAAMREGATLINTARGMVVDEDGLIEVLQARPDLTAILDVTDPEPPAPESPLRSLPNVVLTPHIAGAIGPECARMGQLMADELERYLAREALQHEVTQAMVARMA